MQTITTKKAVVLVIISLLCGALFGFMSGRAQTSTASHTQLDQCQTLARYLTPWGWNRWAPRNADGSPDFNRIGYYADGCKG